MIHAGKRPLVCSALSKFENLLGVAAEVANCRVDLGERDLHSYKFSNSDEVSL